MDEKINIGLYQIELNNLSEFLTFTLFVVVCILDSNVSFVTFFGHDISVAKHT